MSTQTSHCAPEWTVGRLLSWTATHLQQAGLEDGRLASEVLLAHALGCRRIDLYTRYDAVPDDDGLARFRGHVVRATNHEPIAYLVGNKEFFSLSFAVDTRVLIPRPETETLVEAVIDHCAARSIDRPMLWDLGTGSGCIAIAVLKHIPDARCVASDVSTKALAVAESNARRHGVDERLVLLHADRLSIPTAHVPDGGFHVLVTNPPYVASREVPDLDATIREYEPLDALTDGADGLSFFREIGAAAGNILCNDGVVIVEVGDDQAQSVIDAVERPGVLMHARSVKDRTVGMDRALTFALRSRGDDAGAGDMAGGEDRRASV